GKNGVSRAEIESYYRQGIGAFIAEEVDAQFNKIEFLIDRTKTAGSSYGAVLTRNAQNQYVLSYEGFFGKNELETKTVSDPNKKYIPVLEIAVRCEVAAEESRQTKGGFAQLVFETYQNLLLALNPRLLKRVYSETSTNRGYARKAPSNPGFIVFSTPYGK
ncbi:MAG: hypothetical protein LBT33_09850, partial [Spirochaetia bacterium]|nr:hypothetical protein [Spirochaetia bacterium]